MAGEFGALETITRNAAADLSGKQYHGMRLVAGGLCNQASLVTDSDNFGILQNKPESGEAAAIAYAGRTIAVAGAAITETNHISFNASGRVITVTSGDMTHGVALNAAAADGDQITVLLAHPRRWSGAP